MKFVNFKQNREIIVFFIIGTLTVLIDYFFYNLFYFVLNISISLSKGLSFVLGAIFSYYGNNTWTFSNNVISRFNVLSFIVLYLTSLLINVYINNQLLSSFPHVFMIYEFAFLFSTLVSAMVNYFGMKYYVFNKSKIR